MQGLNEPLGWSLLGMGWGCSMRNEECIWIFEWPKWVCWQRLLIVPDISFLIEYQAFSWVGHCRIKSAYPRLCAARMALWPSSGSWDRAEVTCSPRDHAPKGRSVPPLPLTLTPGSWYADWVVNHLGQGRCDQSLRDSEQLDRTILGAQHISALDY